MQRFVLEINLPVVKRKRIARLDKPIPVAHPPEQLLSTQGHIQPISIVPEVACCEIKIIPSALKLGIRLQPIIKHPEIRIPTEALTVGGLQVESEPVVQGSSHSEP